MTEKQLKAKFGKRFAKEYERVHDLFTPLVESSIDDPILTWALFAQACNLTVHAAHMMSHQNLEETARLASAGINESLKITYLFKAKRK